MASSPPTSPVSSPSSGSQNPLKTTMAPPSSASPVSSQSSENQNPRVKYIKYKYTTREPVETCVFRTPDILKETNPGAYIPQYIGFGPYHHFRPQLQVMASKKRAAIEDYLRDWGICDELDTVLSRAYEQLGELEPVIRSCYDQYLDLDEETLSWIVIVDAIVLMYFVGVVVNKKKQEEEWNVEKMVPDFFKLENQVPIVLIHAIRMSLSLDEDLDREMSNEIIRLLLEFCRMHSPIELADPHESINHRVFRCMTEAHLLKLIYVLIMKNYKENPVQEEEDDDEKTDLLHRGRALMEKATEYAGLAGRKARELFRDLAEEFSSTVEKAENVGLKVPGNIQRVSQILGKFDKALKLQQSQPYDTSPCDKPEIPSVSRLYAMLNVKFKPLPKDCGIQNIQFRVPDWFGYGGYTLYLPKIKFGPHTEVILRNLVAYESTILLQEQNDPTRLTDFVDLLCGLIRSEKDVKLLRNAGIIEEGGLPDAEIDRICRGMHKSDGKPHVESKVHQTVKMANTKYKNLWPVKYGRSIMNCFAIGLKGFRAMLPFLIFLFLAFQSFCEVFDCRARKSNVSSVLVLERNDLYNLYQHQEMNSHDQGKLIMLPRKLLLAQ